MSDSINSDDVTPVEERSADRRSSLDLSDEIWHEFATQANAFVTDYFTSVSDLPIFPTASNLDAVTSLSSELPELNASIDEIMEDCRTIRDASRHTGHPRFFGYVASSASPVGAIGDYIASALNQNLTAWRSSPAATDVERTVVRWLGTLIGYSEHAGGLLTSGGSMANLNALYIAHRAKMPEASTMGLWNAGPPMTVYASDQVHLSVAKAADILGLGRANVRIVKSDRNYKLDVRELQEQLSSDIKNGLRPFSIVASAGTVNTGAVDPLAEVAGIAREHNLWFHIDGAYGALGAADPDSRELFSGMELADSVSLDPHKWLYAPIDCGCLLLRDPSRGHSSFAQGDADYIKVYEENEREAYAFWDYGIELTRRFRALKVWMILRFYGSRHITEAIREDISLAKYFGELIEASDDFEMIAPIELSICCFRYCPASWRERILNAPSESKSEINAALDKLNEQLMHKVQRGGRAYLSNALLRGRFALRACIVNFRTTRRDLEMTLDILREAAREPEE